METIKKVSVVVPCYNAAKYLEQCIEQLLRQTIGIDNLEIILVDDASTDGGETKSLIQRYERRFPETILAIFLEENRRQGGARNVGVSYASGEYLTFCDADDWLLEETLEHVYDAAKQYDADVVAFARKNVGEHGVRVGLEKGTRDEFFGLEEEGARKRFLLDIREEGYSSQNKLFRLSLIREQQIVFAEHLIMEEPSFTLPVRLYAKRYYYLDERLYICFSSPGSTVRDNAAWEQRKWDNLQVWTALLGELACRGILQTYWMEVEYLFFTLGIGWSLGMLFQRGCTLTKDEWKTLTEIAHKVLPAVKENPYVIHEEHPFNQAWNRVLLTVLDMSFTDGDVQAANDAMIESARAFSTCPAFA
ncbi:MAG: glycosyltransferase family 2 protein [Lachnospiraceae bacterium]|nr:glycosyltransferase family 2 protein [Lachnospiraceae bacterium]